MNRLGTIIHHLLNDGLTTAKEIEQVTGRSSSTVYRWLNDESEPPANDVRAMVRGLENPQARRNLIALLTSDLPIVVDWIDGHDEADPNEERTERPTTGHDVIERTLLALDCLTHVLAEEHDAVRQRRLSPETYTRLLTTFDQAVRHLTVSKNLLTRMKPDDAFED